MHIWGVTIGVVDRILINFNRTGGLFHFILYTKRLAFTPALSWSGNQGGVKAEKMSSEQDLDGSCRRLLPQLVDIIVAYI